LQTDADFSGFIVGEANARLFKGFLYLEDFHHPFVLLDPLKRRQANLGGAGKLTLLQPRNAPRGFVGQPVLPLEMPSPLRSAPARRRSVAVPVNELRSAMISRTQAATGSASMVPSTVRRAEGSRRRKFCPVIWCALILF
jgi:hypothetical protein